MMYTGLVAKLDDNQVLDKLRVSYRLAMRAGIADDDIISVVRSAESDRLTVKSLGGDYAELRYNGTMSRLFLHAVLANLDCMRHLCENVYWIGRR